MTITITIDAERVARKDSAYIWKAVHTAIFAYDPDTQDIYLTCEGIENGFEVVTSDPEQFLDELYNWGFVATDKIQFEIYPKEA